MEFGLLLGEKAALWIYQELATIFCGDISCCIRKRKKREFRGEKLQDRSVNEGTSIGKRNKWQWLVASFS
jgi:macrodomain Ter protein organizer (MatP/YcbG family)